MTTSIDNRQIGTMKVPMQLRSAELDAVGKDRIVHFSFSSSRAVERPYGLEILSHEVGACDVERVSEGVCPFLWEHNFQSQIGQVLSCSLGTTKNFGAAKLSTSPLGEQTLRDMRAGVRNGISVGYVPKEMRLLKRGTDDQPDTYIIDKYSILEVSSVAVPLDPSAHLRSLEDGPTFEVRVFAAAEPPPPPARSVPREEKKIDPIMTTRTNRELEAMQFDSTLDWYATQSNSSRGSCAFTRDNYSLSKLLLESLDSPRDSWEYEVSNEIGRRTQRTPSGFWVPLNYFARDLSATASIAAGGALIEQHLENELVSVLRPMSVVMNMGARLIENIKSPISFARQDTTGNISWLSENAGVAPFSGVPQFDQLVTVPRRATAQITFSRQLLIQSTCDKGLENLVKQDMLRSIAIAIDYAAINGLGSAYNQPLGLLNYPTASGAITATQVFSFNASAPNWSDVVAMETALTSANILNTDDTFGYVTSPLTAGIWKTTPKNSSGEYLVDRNGRVNNCKFLASNQLANSGVGAAIAGKWSNCMVCTFGVADILSDPYSGASTNTVAVTVTVLVDVVFRHLNGFCLSTG